MTNARYPELETQPLWGDSPPTRLLELPAVAAACSVGHVFAKLEGERPLGNFKVLGGLLAGLRALARATGAGPLHQLLAPQLQTGALPQLICASDGNHGLAVAYAASRAGTRACIYLPAHTSQQRLSRINAIGGEVVLLAGTYDDAVLQASAAARRGEGLLVPDTTTDPADIVVKDVMAGYAQLTRELAAQFSTPGLARPSHVFVQAGVGGLAAAMGQGFQHHMAQPNRLVVVEPEAAACVARALAAGHPVPTEGDLHTCADMLSCGLASAAALEVLLRHDAQSLLVDEAQLAAAPTTLRAGGGPDTTPSGAAGLAGLLKAAVQPGLRAAYGLDAGSSVLLVITESALGQWGPSPSGLPR